MILSRLLPCTLFEIKSPVWNGGKRMVGLDVSRIDKHNEIRFLYCRKSDGMRSIHDNFYFDGDKLKLNDYDHEVHGSVTLAMIPFTDLERLERQ